MTPLIAFSTCTPILISKKSFSTFKIPLVCTSSSTSQPTTSQPIIDPSQNIKHKQPLLIRTAKGEHVHRPPVWLMRQAGRYMAEFRQYSDTIPFRERSENPSIATELSMQPLRAFPIDGVILFSDILTPLPALNKPFFMKAGLGPYFDSPIRTIDQANNFIQQPFSPQNDLLFVRQILNNLQQQLINYPDITLLGFTGAPFTLASYLIEGSAVKNLQNVKTFMYGATNQKKALEKVLTKLSDIVTQYAIFQIDSGAQMIQLFESWAHHLSPHQFATYALPFTKQVIQNIKKQRPDIPIAYFVNGCGGKLDDIYQQLANDLDVLAVDWHVRLIDVRKAMHDKLIIQGNVDPGILAYGCEDEIRNAVRDTIDQVGKQQLILNLGHGVIKETPESAVRVFCEQVHALE